MSSPRGVPKLVPGNDYITKMKTIVENTFMVIGALDCAKP